MPATAALALFLLLSAPASLKRASLCLFSAEAWPWWLQFGRTPLPWIWTRHGPPTPQQREMPELTVYDKGKEKGIEYIYIYIF